MAYDDQSDSCWQAAENATPFGQVNKSSNSFPTKVEELFRSLLNSNADAFVIYDMDGAAQYMNDAFTEIFGWRREELLGRRIPFVPDHEKATAQMYIRLLFSGEIDRCVFETQRLTRDNRLLDVRISGSCYNDGQNKPIGMLSIINDITLRKKAEKALANSEKMLERLSAQILNAQELERKRVARELHDGIQQSLTGIKYKLENALAEMPQIHSGPNASLQAIVPLIQNTLNEIYNITMNLRPSMLDELGLISTIEWFRTEFLATHGDVEISWRIGVKEDEIQDHCKIMIFRIIQEAFNNIVKHSKANRVRLELMKRDRNLELSIKDNGIGFNAEEYLTETFQKGGIGLSSMQERAKLSGGGLHLVSKEGEGVQITARWPIRNRLM